MPYVVGLFFDSPSDKSVLRMRKQIEDVDLSSNITESAYQPHVTLAVYDEHLTVTEPLKQEFAAYCESIKPFSLTLSSVGIFESVGAIFLGVTVATDLLCQWHAFHDTFSRFAPFLHPYYTDGRWLPHCSLAYDLTPAEIAKVIPTCMQFPLPVQMQVQGMEIRYWQGKD